MPSSPASREPAWLLVLWTLVFMQFRPALVGEAMNQAIFGLLVLITGAILWARGRVDPFRIDRTRAIGIGLIILVANYFLCQGLLVSDAAERIIINSTMAIMGPALCFFLIQEPRSQDIILKTFIYAHCVLAVSALVTLVLFVGSGFDVHPILLKVINAKSGDVNDIYTQHSILLPFTVIWSSFGLAGINFPRFIGIYREPGMAQIFFFTAYFLTYFVPVRPLKWVRRLALFGSLATLSTAGFVSFAGGYMALYLFGPGKRKNPATLVAGSLIVALLVWAVIFAPGFGILDKAQNFSGGDRLKSLAQSWDDFTASPFLGQGYYSGFVKDKEGSDVGRTFYGVLDVLRQIGGIGTLLYAAAWFWGVFRLGSIRTLCVYMPCFLTMFTQPSYNDVFVWFLLLLDTRGMRMVHAEAPVARGAPDPRSLPEPA
jgi:hypothetical protein